MGHRLFDDSGAKKSAPQKMILFVCLFIPPNARRMYRPLFGGKKVGG
jgi:hypothetical protein